MDQREAAMKRDAKDVCIICEDDKKPRTRGLCPKHHARYHRARSKIPDNRRKEYDDDLITRGMLLSSKQGQNVEELDEFEEIAKSYQHPYPPAVKVVEDLKSKASESGEKKKKRAKS